MYIINLGDEKMLHTISENIANSLFDEESKYPMSIYVYGIELMISSLIGTIVVLTMGILFKSVIESIIFMVSLSLIRFFSGGYHAQTYIRCNTVFAISALLVFITSKLYIKYPMEYNIIIHIGVFVVSFIIMAIFSPVENENKKIDKSDRLKFKIISISITFIEIILSMFIYYETGFDSVLAVLPTIIVVDVAILVEIILKERRKSYVSKEKC